MWLLLLLLAFLQLVVLVSSSISGGGGGGSPQLLAHRGSKLLCAENTIACHQTALSLGADKLELDARSTKDGHLVVFHDKTTARLAERDVAIADITLKELQEIDIGWRFSDDNGTTYPFRGRGFRVPTLREFISAFPRSTPMSIEIKDNGELGLKTAAGVVSLIRETNSFDRITVASEWCDVIKLVRRLAKSSATPLRTASCEQEVTRFFLSYFVGLGYLYHRIVGAPAFQLMQIPVRSGPWELASKDFLVFCKHYGIELQYWVVNDEKEAERLIDMGVHALITDRVDLLYPLLVSRSLRSPLDSLPPYYNAVRKPGEVHRCVTAVCRILSIKYSLSIIAIMFLAMILTLITQCCLHGGKAKSKTE